MDKFLPSSDNGLVGQQLQLVPSSLGEYLEQAAGFGRRQYAVIIFFVTCALALAFVYLFTTPKQYTAHAMLLMDTSKTRVLQQSQQAFGELPLDSAQVETQIELLKSENIGLSVIKDLKLTEDSEFVGSQAGFFGAIFGVISKSFFAQSETSDAPVSENLLTRRALGRFMGNRDIKRVSRTYVLDIAYTSPNPARAAVVANAIGEAYILDQLDAKYQATRRASAWLQDRVGELRIQAIAADRAVLEFKEQKNIVSTGGGAGNDRLLSEQQVIDVNSQLATARTASAEAKARLDRIQEVMQQDIPDAAVADSLRNDIISRIRSQYLEYDRRRALYAERYGANHLAVLNLRTQMVQLQKSMADELSRLAESYKSDYEIAKAREASLEKSLSQSIAGAQLTNRDRLGLQELESRAKVYHAIHDSFLQRYMEMSQQQSFPITESRLITLASPPRGASSPQTSRVLTLATIIGLILGFGAAVFRESIDRVFRTTRQVEKLLRTNCLAVLPIVKNISIFRNVAGTGKQGRVPAASRPMKIVDQEIDGLFRHVIQEPLSSFAEGFRAVKVAIDINGSIKENKVIGLTSSMPSEGKSTASCNLAELIAHGGSKVILVDADLRNPTLSRKLVTKPDVGLLEVLSGKASLLDAVHTDEVTGLHFLPAVIEARLAHSSEILASEAFKNFVDGLRKSYNYVILDLPPLAPVVDVRATTKVIDSYVFVIAWGQTKLNMVQRQLGSAPEIYDRLLGVILNKANTKVLDRYEDYYGRYYYQKYYARYGYTQ
jgi:succinoglycan biosynthesis transport protein ExoP